MLGKRARNRFFWWLVLPGLLHGEGDTVKELRGCQAQVTPSVPFPLSVCVCVCVCECVCTCGLLCINALVLLDIVEVLEMVP